MSGPGPGTFFGLADLRPLPEGSAAHDNAATLEVAVVPDDREDYGPGQLIELSTISSLTTGEDPGKAVRVLLEPNHAASLAYRLALALVGAGPRYTAGRDWGRMFGDVLDECHPRRVWRPNVTPTQMQAPSEANRSAQYSFDTVMGYFGRCSIFEFPGRVRGERGYWSDDYEAMVGQQIDQAFCVWSAGGVPVGLARSMEEAQKRLEFHWRTGVHEGAQVERRTPDAIPEDPMQTCMHPAEGFQLRSVVAGGLEPHRKLAVTPVTRVTMNSRELYMELVTHVPYATCGTGGEPLSTIGHAVYLSATESRRLAAKLATMAGVRGPVGQLEVALRRQVSGARRPKASEGGWRDELQQIFPWPTFAFGPSEGHVAEAFEGAQAFGRDLRTVLDGVEQLLLEKNQRYGDAALNPVRIMSSASSSEQIRVRIDDKLSRLARGSGEETEDVVTDLLGYLVLLKISDLRERRGE